MQQTVGREHCVVLPDEVAAALINNPGLYGPFSAVEAGPDPIKGTDPEKASKSIKSKAD